MTHFVPVLTLLCAFITPVACGYGQAAPPEEKRVDSLFAEYTRGLTPGVAVAVVRNGTTVLAKGYGLASLEHGAPITPATVFDVASVSKQLTGLAVAMLVNEGRVKLTDDIRKYIPELASALIAIARTGDVSKWWSGTPVDPRPLLQR